MPRPTQLQRRDFLVAGSAVAGSCLLQPRQPVVGAVAEEKTGWLRKTLKIGMISAEGSLTDKFKLAKKAGFEGVELSVPGVDAETAKAASKASGLIIDGTVGVVMGADGETPVVAKNTNYWVGTDVVVAKAKKSRIRDWGRNWDLSGQSADYTQIDWTGP